MRFFFQVACFLATNTIFLSAVNENRNEWELKARNLECNIQGVLISICKMIDKTRALSFDGRYSVIRFTIKIKPKKYAANAILGVSNRSVHLRLSGPPPKFLGDYKESIREAVAENFQISGDDIIVIRSHRKNIRHILISRDATTVSALKKQLKIILTNKFKAIREEAIQKSLKTTTEAREVEEEYEEEDDE